MEKVLRVPYGDGTYEIKRVTAQDGCWLVGQLFTKLLPDAFQAALMAQLKMPISFSANRAELTRQEFFELQRIVLAVVSKLDTTAKAEGIPVSIQTPDGRITEDDVVAVMSLTLHSFAFQVKPFFVEGALKQAMASFKAVYPDLDLSQYNVLGKRDTASDPSSPDGGSTARFTTDDTTSQT